MHLTQAEKDHLKELALLSIRSHFEKTAKPTLTLESETLKAKCGAFVTLKIGGDLRGCIGLIEGIKPLYETVIEMAQAAAFEDPRFPQLGKSEVDDLEIEISALSPLKQIENLDEIRVGEHGLLIRRGYRSGLLLPQVATEYNWDRETFLRHTCLKAGLDENAYQDPACKIYIFSAEVF